MMKSKLYTASFMREENPDSLEDAPKAYIDCYPWDTNGYKPMAYGQICYSASALHVKLTCYETNPKALYKEPNDPVYKDSCLEFFINPLIENNAFIDMEFNANGIMLLGFFSDGHFRLLDTAYHKQINISREISADHWSVSFNVPFSFLEAVFTGFYKEDVCQMKINFYKCGDETALPHYGCWSEVAADKPDFFHNECFGLLLLC